MEKNQSSSILPKPGSTPPLLRPEEPRQERQPVALANWEGEGGHLAPEANGRKGKKDPAKSSAFPA